MRHAKQLPALLFAAATSGWTQPREQILEGTLAQAAAAGLFKCELRDRGALGQRGYRELGHALERERQVQAAVGNAGRQRPAACTQCQPVLHQDKYS